MPGAGGRSGVLTPEPRDLTLAVLDTLAVSCAMTSTEKPRSRALLYWGAAACSLLVGYLDLARGGETIAPLLLVLGYVVLVPLAILKG